MSTEEKLRAFRNRYMEAAGVTFDHWMKSACESPIEQLFLACMLTKGWGPNEHACSSWSDLYNRACEEGLTPGPWILGCEGAACICVVQLPVSLGPKKYRVDFAFLEIGRDPKEGPPRKYAVELDGHDFHERTKEQASSDKRRDRVFTANGWTVLRYTGADVYRDPGAALDEIVTMTNQRCWPWLEVDE